MSCTDAEHTVGVLESRSSNAGSGSGESSPESGGGGAGGVAASEAGTDGASSGSDSRTEEPPPDSFGPPPFVPPFIMVDPECEASAVRALARRLDLYLMIDTNITIPLTSLLNGPFDLITEGVLAYATSPSAAGTGLGIGFYGSGSCDPDEYERPAAPIGEDPLPSNVARIALSLRAAQLPPLTSAIEPALAGALQHARSRLAEHPAQQPVVVLITDAFLDATCNSTSAGLASIAEQGLASSVPSYILELRAFQLPIASPEGSVILPLGEVAEAGGSDHVYRVDLVGAEPPDLRDSLLAIQRDAEPCDYALPEDGVWEELFLAIETSAGPVPIVPLSDASECTEQGGLYLLEPDAPVDETRWARACEASCTAIKNSRRTPSWLYGCPSDPDAGL